MSMQEKRSYQVIREYKRQYTPEELVRRIIRCHVEECPFYEAKTECTEHTINNEMQTGQNPYAGN